MSALSASSSNDNYVLQRDFDASTRLTAQHYLWKAALGYLLHPHITIPTGARIADVATGNGLWLCDLASTVSQQETLDGFDINLEQAPALNTIPISNLSFHYWDILQDPAEDFIGAFDIVHCRLITVIFKDNNPLPVIENLKKLLKPGGYLQWEEVDNVNCKALAPAGGESPALTKMLFQLASSGVADWKERAGDILSDNGFSDVQALHIEHGRLEARYWNDVYMSTWAEFVRKTARDPKTASDLSRQALKEVHQGSLILCPMWIWVAQKK